VECHSCSFFFQSRWLLKQPLEINLLRANNLLVALPGGSNNKIFLSPLNFTHNQDNYPLWETTIRSALEGSLFTMEYVQHKHTIANNLAMALQPFTNSELVSYILYGLDPTYGPFCMVINLRTLLSLARKFLAFFYKKNKNLQMNLSMSLSQLILLIVKDFSLDLLTTLVQQCINSNNAISNAMTIDGPSNHLICQIYEKLGHDIHGKVLLQEMIKHGLYHFATFVLHLNLPYCWCQGVYVILVCVPTTIIEYGGTTHRETKLGDGEAEGLGGSKG
ncbi:hypothetical protein H5410_045042, partial [Solanum commersonii]